LESPGLAELHWELALTSALAPRVRSAMRIAQLPIAVLRDGIIIASLSAGGARDGRFYTYVLLDQPGLWGWGRARGRPQT
jgi:hypothetical protein